MHLGSLVIHIGKLHVEAVLGQKCAGAQRYFNVRGMRNGSTNGNEHTLAFAIDAQMTGYVDNLDAEWNKYILSNWQALRFSV